MQSKGAIKLLAVLLALACIYQLSFTFKTRSVEKKAAEYAAQFPVGQQSEAEQHYLDSVQNVGVYNLGFKKFTYKECKEKELNLGLDLKGGMNVMLEVQVEDVIKALAGDSQNDPAFVEAIAEANAALKEGTSKDYISDFVKAYQRLSNGGSLAAVFVSPDRKDITLESSDADASAAISFEVKQYGNENQMRIVTQYRYDDTSDEATAEVEQIIYDAMKSLYSYDISFEQFRNTQTDVNGILTADKIGPSIAKDMTWNAIYSVLFSLIAIGLYITFRFKRWQWASGATIALAVNALFIIGLFSMLYGFVPFNLEVNQAFIAAILTIIGYAINDTVVVFDRIREYLGMYPKRNLKENVNNAINSTLSRTINTSGTTLVTLLAIFFFGGETIRGFIFALTVGVIVGTVATIFIATPIAYDLMVKRAKFDKEA